MSAPLLRVRGLNAWYGRAQALFGIDLELHRGEVVALVGHNGAGKSTTFKAIVGHMPRVEGALEFGGRSIRGLACHRIARAGLAYVPEDRRIFTELTVAENLALGRQPPRAGAPTWTPEALFEVFPNLRTMPDRLGGRMSGGEQQMLTIARGLMGNPYAVLLDEPSEGIAPKIVEEMAEMILRLKRQGLAVLLSEQNLHFARHVSDRGYVIDKGAIRAAGTMAELEAAEASNENALAA